MVVRRGICNMDPNNEWRLAGITCFACCGLGFYQRGALGAWRVQQPNSDLVSRCLEAPIRVMEPRVQR